MTASKAFNQLTQTLGLTEFTDDVIEIHGQDPVLDTPYLLGDALSGSLAVQAAAVTKIWKMRAANSKDDTLDQRIDIDVMAAVNSASGCNNIYQSGHLIKTGLDEDPTFNIYRTRDDNWIFIAGIYPHLRDGLLTLLNCPNNRSSISKSISMWDSHDLENAISQNELAGSVLRTQRQWRDSQQGKELAKVPVVEIIKIGGSDPEKFRDIKSGQNGSIRPLSDIRVLDMTRVLAGPLASRLLAEQGAHVLHITSPNLPYLQAAVLETGFGKKSAFIDLEQQRDLQILRNLIADTDVFSENYHRSGLLKFGLSPFELARIRPGIIFVSESAFGDVGPWQNRKGVDQIAQLVTGIAAGMGGENSSPKLLPDGYYFMDYLTGYLAAAGTCAALIRRAIEGGSYWVRVSLSRSAMWIQDLGRIESKETLNRKISPEERDKYTVESDSPFGVLRHTAPVARYSRTPSYFEIPVVPLGANKPVWW